jgi:hypothetical protein
MNSKKAVLAAMLAGKKTVETAHFTQVSKQADKIGGAIVISESASKYGDRETDIKSEIRSRQTQVAPQQHEESDRFVMEGHVHTTYQPTEGPKVEAHPEVIAALMSGNKAALEAARKKALMESQQYVKASSPVSEALNEAMGYTPATPQMLNEGEIRKSVKEIIKEELDAILLENIFSENRMMKLYQEQFKKTLGRILEERMAKKTKK